MRSIFPVSLIALHNLWFHQLPRPGSDAVYVGNLSLVARPVTSNFRSMAHHQSRTASFGGRTTARHSARVASAIGAKMLRSDPLVPASEPSSIIMKCMRVR